MKISISTIVALAFLLGVSSCESFGLGPNQNSQISFELVDGEGNAYYPDNLAFTMRQFSSVTPASSLSAPAIQSADSSWVIRVVNIDPTKFGEIDSLQAFGFNVQFYQKEANDLLELDAGCACLNYPDAASFIDRFFTNTEELSNNQRILFSYRRTFAIYLTDPATGPDRSFDISATKRIDNTIFVKGNFELPFGSGSEVFRMEKGEFQFDIPY